MKAKNTQPYIDYDKATFLARLYDFIVRANQMRKDVYTELGHMDRYLAIMQNRVSEMKAAFAPLENPNADCTSHDDDIKALRAFAWEAGLTQTLFEKLEDKLFRYRFTGDMGKPVAKEEIEDRYSDE
ncbi:MAG: hypothetical protein LBU82_01345 [Treponema sp.]|jgi:hypothetical protein|nr:hypothetical protein [Treponema sp.]